MSEQKVIFSGCGHELERVIADMSCPVCARKEIERLTAEKEQVEKDLNAECNRYADQFHQLRAKIERLQARVEALEACKKYARHNSDCNYHWDCSCGLNQALVAALKGGDDE